MYSADVRQSTTTAMVRKQIHLTGDQRAEIAAIASRSGKRQSEVIREAVDRFIEQKGRGRREAILREAAGVWRDRTDLPDPDALRRGWDREPCRRDCETLGDGGREP